VKPRRPQGSITRTSSPYSTRPVDGVDFIAMEYLAGRTLQSIIHCGELTSSDTLNFALQIVQAVAAAHEAGIIHRISSLPTS